MEKKISDYIKGMNVAVIVIDMQNDFIVDDAPIKCPGGSEIIPSIAKLLSACHRNKIPVIYTQEAHRAEKVDFGLELQGDEPEHCLEGSKGIEIISDLAMQPGDFLIVKRRYSSFFATDLDLLLRGLDVDLLVITGVATDVCVRATAQDAQQLNYRVIVPRDCAAGTNEERHLAALENVRYLFGKVCDLSELLPLLEDKKPR